MFATCWHPEICVINSKSIYNDVRYPDDSIPYLLLVDGMLKASEAKQKILI